MSMSPRRDDSQVGPEGFLRVSRSYERIAMSNRDLSTNDLLKIFMIQIE